MKDEDVLITEYRVTALGDSGQYVFDWVNEDANTVKFLQAESDFDDYSNEVENVLNRNGVSIVGSGSSSNTSDTPDTPDTTSENEKTSRPDPIGVSEPQMSDPDTASSNQSDPSDSFKPTDGSSDKSDDSTKESDPDSITRQPEDIGPSTETTEGDTTEMKPSSGDEYSFIVRMNDPSERREIVKKIRSQNEDAADKLELSGPFEVTYRITNKGLELVSVEDIGIGSSVGQ